MSLIADTILLPILVLLETILGLRRWLLPLVLLTVPWRRLVYSRGWGKLTGLALMALALVTLALMTLA